MPIWLRKYTYTSIENYYEQQKEAQEEAERKAKGIQKAEAARIDRPGIMPNYTTKASRR